MIRQLGEGERVKKQLKDAAERLYLRTPKADPKTLPADHGLVAKDIDPADLFDPEEFGIGLRDSRPKP